MASQNDNLSRQKNSQDPQFYRDRGLSRSSAKHAALKRQIENQAASVNKKINSSPIY